MRTWRVGTFSMGASLLFLGIFLLLSQIFGYKLITIMMSWWPIILIVLGLEILIFLFISRQEKPFLKYDFLSIFFVGIIGTIGIGFAVVNSMGILEKVNDVLQREERTLDLPEVEYQLKNEIKRVVVDMDSYPLSIEGTSGDEIALFGTYRAYTGKKEQLISTEKDYVSIKERGDTIYVTVKGLPREMMAPFDRYGNLSATILIPNNVKLEVNGNHSDVTLKPRNLTNNWIIDRVSNLDVQIENNSDIKVTAAGVQNIQGDRTIWNVKDENAEQTVDVSAAEEGNSQDDSIEQAVFQTGQGSHQLQITNSYQLGVNVVN